MNAASVVTFGESMALIATAEHYPTVPPRPWAWAGGEQRGDRASTPRGADHLDESVGADSAGDLIVRELQAEGVRVVAPRDGQAPTGLMIKERRTAASARVWYYRAGSAASALTVEELDNDEIRWSSLLHITGITPALSTSARDATLGAVEVAVAHGVPVSFDLNYRSALWSREAAGDFYREIMPSVDVVFAGEDEAAIATGERTNAEELARALCELGANDAVIKRGEHGALALVGGVVHSRDAVRISVVDTVGAGDAFVAGYLAERVNGHDVDTCLTTATATGAFVCLTGGDWEGAPTRAELALLLAPDPVIR